MSNEKGWIGVDFDGTLATYTPGDILRYGSRHVGAPIPAMVERVRNWIANGQRVKIFTARVWSPPDDAIRSQQAYEARCAIGDWCLFHLETALEITCTKDYDMIQLWDDRAVQVEPNTGIPQVNVVAHKLFSFRNFIDQQISTLSVDDAVAFRKAVAAYQKENP